MSELRWNWVYYPYLDAPNKQEESALKAGYIKVVIKDEADKVIADLEESHKKEVGQLLIEIIELKDKLQNVSELLKETREWLIESQKMHKRCADNAIKKLRHHKYKRCLAMARWCGSKVYHIRRTPLSDMSEHEYWQYENDFWQRWQNRWLELAEKFKEAK